jgi:peptidyl-prolyl cis-trans isomerase C
MIRKSSNKTSMRSFSKPAAFWLVVAALAVGGATLVRAAQTNAATSKPAAKADDLFPDPLVAEGKGIAIKRSQLDDELIAIKGSLPAGGQNMPPNEVIERQVLDRLIRNQLFMRRANEADKAKGREAFAKELQARKTSLNVSETESEDKLNRSLRAQGLTRAVWEERMVEMATISAMLERELKVDVSDADIKKYYEDNSAKFEQPEMVRVSHILLTTRDPNSGTESSAELKKLKRKQIEDILKRARSGEDFAKLAREFSEDGRSKANGGELVPFARGAMRTSPEFEAAAFSLKTNQISDVVTTIFGYHVVRLNERTPARKAGLNDEIVFSPAGYVIVKQYWPVPLENAQKVSDVIRRTLETQKIDERVPDFLEKLKQEAGLKILDDRLKPQGMGKPAPAEPAKSDKKETPPESVKQ